MPIGSHTTAVKSLSLKSHPGRDVTLVGRWCDYTSTKLICLSWYSLQVLYVSWLYGFRFLRILYLMRVIGTTCHESLQISDELTYDFLDFVVATMTTSPAPSRSVLSEWGKSRMLWCPSPCSPRQRCPVTSFSVYILQKNC